MALASSANPRKLGFVPDGADMPAVSRRGNRLAYAEGRINTNIWRVDAPSHRNAVRLISSTWSERWPAYSPDGQRIAFLSTRSGTPEIWICNSDGSNPVQMTWFGGPLLPGPRWSPDGENIAFTASPGENLDVYVLGASAGVARRLTTDPGPDRWPCWSREGRWICFSSGRSGSHQIWRMPAAGGAATQLTPNGVDRDLPQQSPDGKFVYYMKGWPSDCTVWMMPVGGGEEVRVLDSVDLDGQWAVGAKGIYFVAAAGGEDRRDISLYVPATGKTRKTLTVDGVIGEYIAVSPDGRSILYPHFDQAGSDLMLVENFR
jgi:Tol biopolymer transport system component